MDVSDHPSAKKRARSLPEGLYLAENSPSSHQFQSSQTLPHAVVTFHVADSFFLADATLPESRTNPNYLQPPLQNFCLIPLSTTPSSPTSQPVGGASAPAPGQQHGNLSRGPGIRVRSFVKIHSKKTAGS